jgi:hypothetical protein
MTMINFTKRNATQAADRLCRFYSGQMQDGIICCLWIPPPPEIAALPPLVEPAPDDDVIKERDPVSWTELPALLEQQRRQVRANLDNPDDSLPSMVPVFHFENAIETAMLGGKVRFMGTRLHTFGDPIEPLIRDYADFSWELPREDNVWFRRFLEAYRFMACHAGNDFALGFQGGINSMNLAVQLRGTVQAYADIYEEPENLRRLLDYSIDLNVYLYGRAQEIAGAHNLRLYGDHPLSEYRADRVPNASVDAYSLCKPGTLREWGAEQLARFNRLVGGGNLHIHENSRHVIEEVVEIPGWRSVWFSDGTGWPRAFDIRHELRQRMREVPMAMCCGKEELLQGLAERSLPGNTSYGAWAGSLDEANRIMDLVREYRV